VAALERLGDIVAGYQPDDAIRAAVKLRVADTLGAWIAATATAEGRALTGFRQPQASLPERIAISCALARLSEVDDIHLGAMITPGAIVIPAALTIAASMEKVVHDDLTAAVVAGYEAMIRLGTAIDGPSVLYRGIWPTYFAAPFGVAAVASRLLKLDADKTAHALATALIMASPGTGHHVAVLTARWLAVGHAAARGFQAAQAAAAGFSSDVALLEGDLLKNIYGLSPDREVIAEPLDVPSLMRASFKPWRAARQTMAATQALKEILAEGLAPDAITSVEAAVLPAHRRMIDHGVTAGDRFSHLTSLQYQMAVAALTPEAALDLSPAPGGPTPAAQALMARISVRDDESLLAAGYPNAWPARVTVATASGRHERLVRHVPGDPARPYDESAVKRKFVRVTAPILEPAQADAMFARSLAAFDALGVLLKEIDGLGPR
jgi:2-methylcitrate dehydratase PrpD